MVSTSLRSRFRSGFTLVELLVVIAIIGILVALLLPAIQAAREAGRRMSCSNKVKQLGVALHNYHDVHQIFPPDAIWFRRDAAPPATAGEERNFTWISLILPFIEQKPLHDQINFGAPAWAQTVSGTPLYTITLDGFLCPSDTTWTTKPHRWGYTSYGANGGWDGHRRSYGDSQRAGVINTLDAWGIRDIRDGTAQTVLIGEVSNRGFCCYTGTQWNGGSGRSRVNNESVVRSLLVAPQCWVMDHAWIQAGGGPLLRADSSSGPVWGPWAAPYMLNPQVYGSYALNNEWPGPGSHHPGGAMFCMSDGAVKYINENIATGDGVTIGDNLGRFGNVFTAMFFSQGNIGQATVNLQ